MAPALLDYVQALLAASRGHLPGQTAGASGEAGARRGLSPRAGLMLLAAARAWALLAGRPMVVPEDVQAVFPSVAGHRLAGGARAGALQAQNADPRRRAAVTAVAAPVARAPPRGASRTHGRALRQRAFRGARRPIASPVVLRHSRIYILPTRRGYAVIATLITMLLTSLNYALSLGLGVTFLLGGLVAAALLHTFRNLAGIEIKPLAASDAFAGGHVVFSLGDLERRDRPRARSRSPPTACSATAAIAAGSTQTVTLAAPAHGRGAAFRSAASRCRRCIRSACGAAGLTCIFR